MPKPISYEQDGVVRTVKSDELDDDQTSERALAILRTYGIRGADMQAFTDAHLLSSSGLVDDILEAGRVFGRAGKCDFSLTDISLLLLNKNWGLVDPGEFKKKVKRVAAKYFGKEARTKASNFNLKVTSTQVVREKTGCYSGNLYEARGTWAYFRASDTDLAKSIRIPGIRNGDYPSFTDNELFVLGCIFAVGHINGDSHKSPSIIPRALVMHGDKNDIEFYEGTLEGLVENVFNTKPEVVRRHHEANSSRVIKHGEYEQTSMFLYSTAITSWLVFDLGFPKPKTRRKGVSIPGFAFQEETAAPFLSGIISAKANYCQRVPTQTGRLCVVDHHEEFVQQVAELVRIVEPSAIYSIGSRESNFNPGANTYYLSISPSTSEKLKTRLDIKNPNIT